MQNLRDSKGFGLIELMICVAIMSIVMAGTAAQFQNSLLANETGEVKNSKVSLEGILSQIILNVSACTLAVTQKTQSYGPAIEFDLPDGTALFTGSKLPNYSLDIASLQFTGSNLVGTGFDGSKAYFGSIVMAVTSEKRILGPQNFAPRLITQTYLTVSPSGVITACGPVMPQLPTAPVVPPPINPQVLQDFIKTCTDIGGTFINGTCTGLNTGTGTDNGIGNGGINNGKGGH